jgi:all-trans-retinol 13,14-reductase
MLDQYSEHYPQLAPMIRHAELSTPLSTNHFARSHRGSIYGLATEPDRFSDDALRSKTPMRRLYLAGADVLTPGVAGALGGGALAVVAAEPLRATRHLRPIMRPKH